jgi:DNA polymerase zeta
MCDFGLYGCGWINLAEVWQRGHEQNDNETTEPATFKLSPHFRQSRMPLEVDVAAHQILNRRLLSARNIHHKLAIPSPPLPSEPFVLSVRELWDDERRRRLAKGLSPTPALPIDSSKMSRGHGGEWVAEARWWEEVRKRIEKERDLESTFTNSVELWEKWVMTTFESVEALWEAEWRTWKPARKEATTGHNGQSAHTSKAEDKENPFAHATQDGSSINQKGPPQSTDIDVDEMLLSTQEMSQMMDREDQEWADLQAGDIIAEPDAAVADQFAEEGPPPDFGVGVPSSSGEDKAATDGNERFNYLVFSLVLVLTLASADSTLLRGTFPEQIHFNTHGTIWKCKQPLLLKAIIEVRTAANERGVFPHLQSLQQPLPSEHTCFHGNLFHSCMFRRMRYTSNEAAYDATSPTL